MEDIIFYAKLGWDHVVSRDALDHQLFLVALSLGYCEKEWKNLVLVITAFTLGHCLTLAFSMYQILSIPSTWIELLIPVTIVCTSVYSFFSYQEVKQKMGLEFLFAFLFGLIHGLGFANTLKILLSENQNFVTSLFGFNLGVEAAQLIFILICIIIQQVILKTTNWKPKLWRKAISCIIFITALSICLDRIGNLH